MEAEPTNWRGWGCLRREPAPSTTGDGRRPVLWCRQVKAVGDRHARLQTYLALCVSRTSRAPACSVQSWTRPTARRDDGGATQSRQTPIYRAHQLHLLGRGQQADQSTDDTAKHTSHRYQSSSGCTWYQHLQRTAARCFCLRSLIVAGVKRLHVKYSYAHHAETNVRLACWNVLIQYSFLAIWQATRSPQRGVAPVLTFCQVGVRPQLGSRRLRQHLPARPLSIG